MPNRKKFFIIKRLLIGLLTLLLLLLIGGGVYLLNQHERLQRQQKEEQQKLQGEIVASMNGVLITSELYTAPMTGSQTVPSIQATTDRLYGGERLKGKTIETTIRILQLLQKNQLAVTTVTIYNDTYMELVLSQGVHVLYAVETDAYILTSSLQTMLSVFTIEGVFPKEVDFRFDKPVIRY